MAKRPEIPKPVKSGYEVLPSVLTAVPTPAEIEDKENKQKIVEQLKIVKDKGYPPTGRRAE